MNEDLTSKHELGEAIGGAFDEAALEPIDDDETDGGNTAAKQLADLLLAPPEKAEIKSGDSTKLFVTIQKLQRPGASADELNNVGCAWALLAYNEARLDYWPRAKEALQASAAHEKATDKQKKRSEENLGHVKKAQAEMELT
ncbi:MAG: hypothetical protein WKF41_13165 [Gaiellaceae bacterium]